MPAKPRFSITSEDLPKVRAQMAELPSWYLDQVKGLMEERLGAFKAEMVVRSSTGPIYRQTGDLSRSYGVTVEGSTLATLSAFMASYSLSKVYTLEFGGTIRPQGGSLAWIYIPTDVNRKFNKTPIKSVSQVRQEGHDNFINRLHPMFREGQQIIAPQAVIDGQPSPAWNLLLDSANVPMFIQTKYIIHTPKLGFFDTGIKHSQRMADKLAAFVVDYWKTAA